MVLGPLALRPQVDADLGGDEQVAGSLRCEEGDESEGGVRMVLARRELECSLRGRVREASCERRALLVEP
jgi:hypothetical protein